MFDTRWIRGAPGIQRGIRVANRSATLPRYSWLWSNPLTAIEPVITRHHVSRHCFLEHHIALLTSPEREPRRPCPSCGNATPALTGPRTSAFGPLPRYRCTGCNLRYSRLTGTPLARLHVSHEAFVRLLARLTEAESIRRAADDIGVGEMALARLVRAIRVWLLELDPTGAQEAGVRLGGHVLSPQQRPPVQRGRIRRDSVLARTLGRAVDELRSQRNIPVPTHCPHCESSRVRLQARASSHTPYPTYACRACRRLFSRLTGSPVARSRWPEKQRLFLQYLDEPMQLTEVATLLGVDHGTVRDWRERYRELATQLDPTGGLSAQIRLAPQLADEPCAHCGRTDTLTWDAKRHWHCSGCGRFYSARVPIPAVA